MTNWLCEFIGELFQCDLIVYGIKCFRTKPYTPQQNGKIERFWETLEKSATKELNGKYLEIIVSEYNSVCPHNGLLKLTVKPMTPLEAWNAVREKSPDFTYRYGYLSITVNLLYEHM